MESLRAISDGGGRGGAEGGRPGVNYIELQSSPKNNISYDLQNDEYETVKDGDRSNNVKIYSLLMVLYGLAINTPTTANTANLDFFMFRLKHHHPEFIFTPLTLSMFIVGNTLGL